MKTLTTLILIAQLLCHVLAEGEQEEDSHGAFAVSYDADTFREKVPSQPHFVMFYAPWCGHCKRLSPTFDELAKKYNIEQEKKGATVAKVDCTTETALCSDHGVSGYPTLKFYSESTPDGERFKGLRDMYNLDKFLRERIQGKEPKDDGEDPATPTVSSSGLFDLDDKTFDDHIETGHHFIKFYAPWCGHCKRLAPTWELLASEFKGDDSISIAKIDCTLYGTICSKQDVNGYPTLKWFSNGKMLDAYRGAREFDQLKRYVLKMRSAEEDMAQATEEKIPSPEDQRGSAAILTDDSFKEHVAKGYHFIKFYAPWCPHCQRIEPLWNELAASFKDDSDLSIAKVDCTEHGATCKKFNIKGYPTMLWFKDGDEVEKYSGARDLSAFKNYVVKMKEAKAKAGEAQKDEAPVADDKESNVKHLDVNTFEEATQGSAFIKFYAPWCGHCKSLVPTWEELGNKFADNTNVLIGKVDCTLDRDVCTSHGVNGYPTLIFFRKGEKVKEFSGGRDIGSLQRFVTDNLPHDEL